MSRYIIDVRTAEEYAMRHLEGSVNINYHDPEFLTRILTLPKDAEIIVYCNAGGRAGRARTRLLAQGFSDVTSYGIMRASVATRAQVLYQSDR